MPQSCPPFSTSPILTNNGLMETLAFHPGGKFLLMGGRIFKGDWNAALFRHDSAFSFSPRRQHPRPRRRRQPIISLPGMQQRPPRPHFDIGTVEPIEPPWQAINKLIADAPLWPCRL
jgi:hypothetical protein